MSHGAWGQEMITFLIKAFPPDKNVGVFSVQLTKSIAGTSKGRGELQGEPLMAETTGMSTAERPNLSPAGCPPPLP